MITILVATPLVSGVGAGEAVGWDVDVGMGVGVDSAAGAGVTAAV